MWFDDQRSAGKRLFIDVRRMNRKPAAKANIRLGSKGDSSSRMATAAVIFLLSIGLLALVWFLLAKAGEALYSQNDRYKIVHLDIKTGKVLTPELIQEYTHIHEGMNLFGFDAKTVRADVLHRAPNVKSISFTRQLPDTVKIDVVERDPVARFGGKSGLLVADRDGYVFILRTGRPELPVILGYKDESLKPTTHVQGSTLLALEALDACNDPRLALRVDSIDVGREEYLLLSVPYDEVVWEIKLAWRGMGSGSPESRKDLLSRLSKIVQTLQSPQTKGRTKMDVTLDGGRVYVQ